MIDAPQDPPAPAALRAGDMVLAAAVAVLLSAIITLSQVGAGVAASPVAYLFAAGFGALQLLRRTLPVPMLVLSALGTFAYYTLELPTIGVALPVVAALYSAAEQGLLRWSAGTGATVFAVSLGFRLRDDPQPLGYLLGTDALTNLALIAAALALGAAVRAHRLQSAQREQIASLQEERVRRDAQLRMREEREMLSRELHDTVGHALSVIALHAGVARDAVGRDDEETARAVEQVRAQAGDSLQELRGMVRLLRSEVGAERGGEDVVTPDASRHVRSLADLPTILASARSAGLVVDDNIEVPTGSLSSATDAAAYRMVQEAVTNVLRHAGASTLRIDIRVLEERLRVSVADDGRGDGRRAESVAGGVGLEGMRERLRLLGGSLTIRTAPGAGFEVEASIPARSGGEEGRS